MNCSCALLWNDDDDMLISHVSVAMKGYSHAIPIKLNDYDHIRDRPDDLN